MYPQRRVLDLFGELYREIDRKNQKNRPLMQEDFRRIADSLLLWDFF